MSSSEQAERLRAAGLKVTGPRVAILDAVERNRHHPSVEEIFQELAEHHPSLAQSSMPSDCNCLSDLFRTRPEFHTSAISATNIVQFIRVSRR